MKRFKFFCGRSAAALCERRARVGCGRHPERADPVQEGHIERRHHRPDQGLPDGGLSAAGPGGAGDDRQFQAEQPVGVFQRPAARHGRGHFRGLELRQPLRSRAARRRGLHDTRLSDAQRGQA
ncbi:MAG: hypothetical protein MZU95_11030 [Desulfomicrobium escambiense]|nr:hypothetical protein [Desulfomicrobium escambiense]